MSFTNRVIAYFIERPSRWIPATEFEAVGGRQAWRTRIANARAAFRASGEGDIDNRVRRLKAADGTRYTVSEYIFLPAPKPTAAEREMHNANEWGLR